MISVFSPTQRTQLIPVRPLSGLPELLGRPRSSQQCPLLVRGFDHRHRGQVDARQPAHLVLDATLLVGAAETGFAAERV
jgi:hypothetical protein